MRRAFSAILFTFGIAGVFYFLAYRFPTMSNLIADIGIAVCSAVCLIALVIFFWPVKKEIAKALDLLIEKPQEYYKQGVHTLILSVKNKDKRNKIVELHATTVYIDQFHIQDDAVKSNGNDRAMSLIWTNGTEKTDLMPKAKDGLMVAALGAEPSRGIHFGGLPTKNGDFGFCTAFFEKELVFKYQIRFQGRYEKELEYREYIYVGVIYSKPFEQVLVHGHDAINFIGLSPQLIEKIKRIEEEIGKEFKR